ncbi:MAG: hypothetical protein HYZ39_16280 [Mycolicibacterium cosmeticum]|nr:hypothetical protein [Mycolicibacterium cosmeticum]
MNATEDETEPLGESPAIDIAPSYSAVHEITMYQARCTNCGHIEDDYGDFAAWTEFQTSLEIVTENRGWLAVYKPLDSKFGELVRQLDQLLCPECQTCAVCGKTPCYPHDDGQHAVCGDHEDHEFETVQ